MGADRYSSDPKSWKKIKWRHDNKAEYTDPHGKPAPEPAINYKSLRYKNFPDKVKLGIYFDENRLPKEATPPPKKKYDAKGRYIKEKQFVEVKKESKSEKKKPRYSLGQLMRDSDINNPNNQTDFNVGRKK